MNYEENLKLNYKELEDGEEVLKSMPVDFTIGTTLRCNMNCIMCYRRTGDRDTYKIDVEDKILDKIIDKLKYLQICRWHCDGEIFSSKNIDKLFELMGEVPQQSIENGFCTNGLWMYNYAQRIADSNINSIDISIDAVDAELYKKIRVGGTIEKVVYGIKEVKRLAKLNNKNIRMKIIFVAMKMNIQELPKIVELANELDIKTVHVMQFNSAVVTRDLKNEGLNDSFEEEKKYFMEAFNKSKKYNINLIHPYSFKFINSV